MEFVRKGDYSICLVGTLDGSRDDMPGLPTMDDEQREKAIEFLTAVELNRPINSRQVAALAIVTAVMFATR